MRLLILLLVFFCSLEATEPLIINAQQRAIMTLDGAWKTIVDPYENGFYSYRYTPRADGFFMDRKQIHKSELIEYNFDESPTLDVPGDWNSQREELFFYEGTLWYRKKFELMAKPGKRYFIYFGAVNYNTVVYLNGKKLGSHEGGFTPFNFEVTEFLKSDGPNSLVLKVDNKRRADGVPTLNTDWWNYGGITRPVYLLETPSTFIRDYFVQLDPENPQHVSGWLQLDGGEKEQRVRVNIEGSGISKSGKTNADGYFKFSISATTLKKWSPEEPRLYDVSVSCETDSIRDEIGFRDIVVKDNEIYLNGKAVFLRGISLHEEAPLRGGRAWSKADAEILLQWAQDLGCNFVRLAHYPHNENMLREADKRGLLVWAEIPVYWTIKWDNPETFRLAKQQLQEMISRDKNRASVIIWSVANETPLTEKRLEFLNGLIDEARAMDDTRLISAATELTYNDKEILLDDPLCASLDVIGANEYLGWYGGKPADIPTHSWKSAFNKPLIISEFGAGALYGFHADAETRWSEEYQALVYEKQLQMLKRVDFLRGMSPWILVDFRSPRRQLPGIQDFWNRKGLIDDRGRRKQAFDVLQSFYRAFSN